MLLLCVRKLCLSARCNFEYFQAQRGVKPHGMCGSPCLPFLRRDQPCQGKLNNKSIKAVTCPPSLQLTIFCLLTRHPPSTNLPQTWNSLPPPSNILPGYFAPSFCCASSLRHSSQTPYPNSQAKIERMCFVLSPLAPFRWVPGGRSPRFPFAAEH